MALELSMAAPTSTASAPATTPAAAAATTSTTPAATTAAATTAAAAAGAPDSNFLDSAFVSQLLESVDVDQNDPLFQAALAQINQAGAKGDEKSGEGAEEDKNNRKRKGDDGA
jgi:hypothetical protein